MMKFSWPRWLSSRRRVTEQPKRIGIDARGRSKVRLTGNVTIRGMDIPIRKSDDSEVEIGKDVWIEPPP
jgi:hypothetical protein